MLNSFIIVLREGFESFLLVAVIVTYLRKPYRGLLAVYCHCPGSQCAGLVTRAKKLVILFGALRIKIGIY